VLNLWFWVTPIIWSLDLIPDRFRYLTYVNPFTPFVTAYRDVILRNNMPSLLTVTAVMTLGVLVFLLGAAVFQKKQRRFAEEI